jgi:hypothetical protein
MGSQSFIKRRILGGNFHMTSLNAVVSRLTVLALTVSVLAGQTMFAFALPGRNVTAGEMTVTGTTETNEKPFVLVNGDRAFSGRTFLSDGVITTTETTSAVVNFGKIGRVNIGPNSNLTLAVSETTITGTLTNGTIGVSNSDGVAVKIITPDDSVTNQGTEASRFTVNVAANTSSVAAESGSVLYNNGAAVATKQDDDDDDDDDGEIWVPIVVIGGTIGAVLLFTVFDDDDDEIVSPVR